MNRYPANPYKYYLTAALLLTIGIGFLLWYFTRIHPLWLYLISLSTMTFILYGYDKYRAMQGGGRIPELILHLFALIGGTPGALAGQQIFRHKTQKLKFRVTFIIIIMVQVGLLCWWFWGRHR